MSNTPGWPASAGAPEHHDPLEGRFAGLASARPNARRDERVREAWSKWWKAVHRVVITYVVLIGAGLFAGATATISDVYDTGQSSASRSGVALFVVGWLIGTVWSTLGFISAARASLDAWNPIAASDGRLKGHGSIVWLTFSAVSAVVWLLAVGATGVWLVSRAG